jgi:hypothetical protein
MYVNYCGSREKDIEIQIRRAAEDCKRRRGQLFTQSPPASPRRSGLKAMVRVTAD